MVNNKTPKRRGAPTNNSQSTPRGRGRSTRQPRSVPSYTTQTRSTTRSMHNAQNAGPTTRSASSQALGRESKISRTLFDTLGTLGKGDLYGSLRDIIQENPDLTIVVRAPNMQVNGMLSDCLTIEPQTDDVDTRSSSFIYVYANDMNSNSPGKVVSIERYAGPPRANKDYGLSRNISPSLTPTKKSSRAPHSPAASLEPGKPALGNYSDIEEDVTSNSTDASDTEAISDDNNNSYDASVRSVDTEERVENEEESDDASSETRPQESSSGLTGGSIGASTNDYGDPLEARTQESTSDSNAGNINESSNGNANSSEAQSQNDSSDSDKGAHTNTKGDSTCSNNNIGLSVDRSNCIAESYASDIETSIPPSMHESWILDYLSYKIQIQTEKIIGNSSHLSETKLSSVNNQNIANEQLNILRCLARVHILMRKIYFSQSLFVESVHRPADERDQMLWATSMQRINFATFLLLIFVPDLAVLESIDKSMLNHDYVVRGIALDVMSRVFFSHIVPGCMRDEHAIDLLVCLRTQRMLQVARNESHLQSMISEERNSSESALSDILALPDKGDHNEFDRMAIDTYQRALYHKLDNLSGGSLQISRSRYPLHELQKSVTAFISGCSGLLPLPVIIDDASRDESDHGESSDEVNADAEVLSQGSQELPNSIDGEFEVTIIKPTTNPKAESSRTNGRPTKQKPKPKKVDTAYSEEIKTAIILREAINDPHLEEFIKDIEAEEISIPKEGLQGGADVDTSEVIDQLNVVQREFNAAIKDPLPRILNELNSGNDLRSEYAEFQVDDSISEFEEDQRLPPESPSHHRSRKRAREAKYNESNGDSDNQSTSVRIQRPHPRRTRPRYQSEDDGNSSDNNGNGKFHGRRGIPAERISQRRREDQVQFTPSPNGSADEESGDDDSDRRLNNEEDGSDGESDRRSAIEDAESRGQYRPLNLTKREPNNRPESRSRRRGAKRQQRRVKWTEEEEECFIEAMNKYGPRWAKIEDRYGRYGTVNEVLRHRNRRQLKDKARNIKIRLLREGKPLGVFEQATGHL